MMRNESTISLSQSLTLPNWGIKEAAGASRGISTIFYHHDNARDDDDDYEIESRKLAFRVP